MRLFLFLRLKYLSPILEFLKPLFSKIVFECKLHCFPFKPSYTPSKPLVHYFISKGFEKLAHNYFGFSVFPGSL